MCMLGSQPDGVGEGRKQHVEHGSLAAKLQRASAAAKGVHCISVLQSRQGSAQSAAALAAEQATMRCAHHQRSRICCTCCRIHPVVWSSYHSSVIWIQEACTVCRCSPGPPLLLLLPARRYDRIVRGVAAAGRVRSVGSPCSICRDAIHASDQSTQFFLCGRLRRRRTGVRLVMRLALQLA